MNIPNSTSIKKALYQRPTVQYHLFQAEESLLQSSGQSNTLNKYESYGTEQLSNSYQDRDQSAWNDFSKE